MVDGDDILAEPSEGRVRRFGRQWLNVALLIAIVVVVTLYVRSEQDRRKTERELAQVKQATQQSGEERAKEVIEKVRRHIDIPTDPQPTVATIVDVERLREASPFYAKADNGDHLVVTQNRAILYDPDRDIIIDVAPVTIQPSPSGEPEASGAARITSPAPTTRPTPSA